MPWIIDMPPEVVEQLLDFYSSDLVHDADGRVQNLTNFLTSSYLGVICWLLSWPQFVTNDKKRYLQSKRSTIRFRVICESFF